jgi:hypothetical protein
MFKHQLHQASQRARPLTAVLAASVFSLAFAACSNNDGNNTTIVTRMDGAAGSAGSGGTGGAGGRGGAGGAGGQPDAAPADTGLDSAAPDTGPQEVAPPNSGTPTPDGPPVAKLDGPVPAGPAISCGEIRNCIVRAAGNMATAQACVMGAPAAAQAVFRTLDTCSRTACPLQDRACRCRAECLEPGACVAAHDTCTLGLLDLFCDGMCPP